SRLPPGLPCPSRRLQGETLKPLRTVGKFTLVFACLSLAIWTAGLAVAGVVQKGTLLVDVDGHVSPHKLPREGRAPVAVSVGWHVSTTDGTQPPQLKKLQIEINRNGILDPTGLPICPYEKIQPALTSRALKNCRSSLVGRGSFAAIVGIEGQESYVAKG